MTITVACDGSALGNPGPAGWAWFISEQQWAAGGWPESTNNRGELQAVIEILRASADTDQDIHILADSKYVINSVTKWMPVWKRNSWKKKGGGEVLNRDQMEILADLVDGLERDGRRLTFEWVKGHSSHELNEAADRRARAAAAAYQACTEVPRGPGLRAEADTPAADIEAGSHDDAGDGAGEQPQTVRVWCDLDAQLAEAIVEQARVRSLSPHERLSQLIRAGWEAQ